MKLNAFFLATLLSGLAVSILSIVECTAGFNFLFCGWVWVGVFFAVNHYNRLNHYDPIATPAQGAVIGVTTGAISATVFSFLSYFRLMSLDMTELLKQLAEISGIEVEEIVDLFPNWSPSLEANISIANFLVFLILFVIIGAIGGTATAVVMSRRTEFIEKYKARFEELNKTDSDKEN